MFDSEIGKIICWILALVTIAGGINYLFVAQGNDLVKKISSKTSTQKAIYYILGISAALFLVVKILHHSGHHPVGGFF